MAETYYDLLRRPEWQRKRLAIMERAGFRCEECDAVDKTLNVHHRHYTKGAKPWEYPDDALACLCEECHKERHSQLDCLKVTLGKLGGGDLERVQGYARALLLQDLATPDNQETMTVGVLGYEHAMGIADAYELTGNAGVDAVIANRSAKDRISHATLNRLSDEQQERRPR